MTPNVYDDFERVAGLILGQMAAGRPVSQSAVYSALVGNGVSQRSFLSAWVRLSMRGRIKLESLPTADNPGTWRLVQ